MFLILGGVLNLLSFSDTWLLLMSVYLHDIGMSLTYDLIEETWQDEKFQDHLKYISEKSNDKDLKEAANYLLDIQNGGKQCQKVNLSKIY